MPRHNRRQRREPTAAGAAGGLGERLESWQGLDYVVRAMAGSAAGKFYRCPGCDQEIRPGTPHLVSWPAEDRDARDRRHWHSPCWVARDRRGPGIARGRSAPRH